jgi:hypothetical protein
LRLPHSLHAAGAPPSFRHHDAVRCHPQFSGYRPLRPAVWCAPAACLRACRSPLPRAVPSAASTRRQSRRVLCDRFGRELLLATRGVLARLRSVRYHQCRCTPRHDHRLCGTNHACSRPRHGTAPASLFQDACRHGFSRCPRVPAACQHPPTGCVSAPVVRTIIASHLWTPSKLAAEGDRLWGPRRPRSHRRPCHHCLIPGQPEGCGLAL